LKNSKNVSKLLRISKFQESFTTYKWVIMYMMYEEKLLRYNKIKECEILIFVDDSKF
jgi:hypothetical protein